MCFWDVWSQALLITVQHRTPRLPHCSTDPHVALGERSGCQAGNEFPCGLRLMKWGLCLQGGQGVRPLKNPRAGQDWACQLTGLWLTDGHVRLKRAGWIGYWTVVHLTWKKQPKIGKKSFFFRLRFTIQQDKLTMASLPQKQHASSKNYHFQAHSLVPFIHIRSYSK